MNTKIEYSKYEEFRTSYTKGDNNKGATFQFQEGEEVK